MYGKKMAALLILGIGLFMARPSWAAHPLITDDTGTQGKGRFQLEVNGQYDWDKADIGGISFKAEGSEIAPTLSYGIADHVDLVATLPYLRGQVKENDVNVYDECGIGDATLEVKWRLFEKDHFTLAVKPGMILPTGDHSKGLGAGNLGGQIFLIASQELGSLALHGNLGYIRNENSLEERKNLWHASLAATWEAVKNLKLAANVGIERNVDSHAKNDPAFLIGGVIYSIAENFDVDVGVKCGLTESETDLSLMGGMAFRF